MIRSAKDFLSLNQCDYDDGMIRPAKGFFSRIVKDVLYQY